MWPPTLSPVLRMPDLATTRSLLTFPELRHRRRFRRQTAGRVTGLATVLPQPQDDVVEPLFEAEPEIEIEAVVPEPVERVERVRLVAQDRPVVPASVLTRAVDEYVGEPVEPVIPYRNYDIGRFVDQVTGSSAPGMDMATALAALAGFSSEATAAPPRRAPAPAPDSAEQSPQRGRSQAEGQSRPRPTLGQSRRRGVGHPGQPEPAPMPDVEITLEPPESLLRKASQRPTPPSPDVPAPEPTRVEAAEPPVVERVAPEPAEPVVGTPESPPAAPIEPVSTEQPPAEPTAVAPPQPEQPRPVRRLGLGDPLPSVPPRATQPRSPLSAAPPTPPATPSPAAGPPTPPTMADMISAPLPPAPKPAPPQAKTPEPAPQSVEHAPFEPPPPVAEPTSPPSVATTDPAVVDVMSVRPAQTWVFEQESPPGMPAVELPPLVHPVARRQVATRATVVTPVYRSTLATLPPPVEAVTTAPADVAVAVRSVVGVDVSDVPVRRGPEVTAAAQAVGARAFTTQAEVHLPAEAGHLDSPPTRALLAHELVHAAQQRVLGAALPSETSPEGQLLERTAVATERWVRGDPPPQPALVHRPTPPDNGTVQAAVEQTRLLARQVDRIAEAQAAMTSTAQPIQRAPDGEPTSTMVAPPPETGPTITATPANAATMFSSWSLTDVIAPERTEDGTPDIAELRDALAGLRQSVSELADRQPQELAPNLNDHATLDDLAGKLFGRIRSRLRRELLVDRERSGRLTDFR
jgi:hypothetical protein